MMAVYQTIDNSPAIWGCFRSIGEMCDSLAIYRMTHGSDNDKLAEQPYVVVNVDTLSAVMRLSNGESLYAITLDRTTRDVLRLANPHSGLFSIRDDTATAPPVVAALHKLVQHNWVRLLDTYPVALGGPAYRVYLASPIALNLLNEEGSHADTTLDNATQ